MYKEARTCVCGYSTYNPGNWCVHRKTCKTLLKQPLPETELVLTLRAELAAKTAQLSVKDEQLSAKDQQLEAKDNQLAAKDDLIKEQLSEIKHQREEIKLLERIRSDRFTALNEEVKRLRKRKRGPKRIHRTEPERREIAKRQNWLCAGKDCPQALSGKELEGYDIDHIVPLSMGGTESLENLQALCPGCHRKKTDQERLLD